MGKIKIILGASLLLLVSVQVNAALIEQDLFSADDGLITFDTNTDLEWLDLAPTFLMSYNEALATTYVTDLGFRHATFDEMVELYAGVNIFHQPGTSSPFHSSSVDNIPGVEILLDLFGCIGQCLVGEPFGQGWIDIGLEDRTSYSFFQGIIGDGEAQINDLSGTHTKDSSHFQTSNFLVRSISPIPAAIDIKPGSDPNSVNLKSKGVIPVAVLGSTDFDATQVDFSTVTFGPDGASPAHDGHVEDVNDDGFVDMVFHFKTRDTGIICGDTEATLTGETFDGLSITGTDTVKTVGCNSSKQDTSISTKGAGAMSWIFLIGLSVLGLWRQKG